MSVLVYEHYTHKCIKIQLKGGGEVLDMQKTDKSGMHIYCVKYRRRARLHDNESNPCSARKEPRLTAWPVSILDNSLARITFNNAALPNSIPSKNMADTMRSDQPTFLKERTWNESA